MLYTSRANGRLGRLWRQQRIKYGSGVLLIATRTSKTIACIIINPYRYNVESIFSPEIVLEARCRGLRSIKSVRVNCVTTFGYEAISRSVACQKGYQRICVGCMAKGNHHWPYRCWLLLKRRGNHHIGADCMFEGHPSVDQRPLSSRHVRCASYFDWYLDLADLNRNVNKHKSYTIFILSVMSFPFVVYCS